MKIICFLAAMVALTPCIAQSHLKAEQDFLDALNEFASVKNEQHWAHGESVMESPFRMIGDSLTATFRYRGDSGDYRLRFTAPIKQLKQIDQDVYLIMVFSRGKVNIHRNETANTEWRHWTFDSLVHLGKVETEEDESRKQKILDAWNALQATWEIKER